MDIAVCDDNLSDREIIRQQLSIYFSDRFIEYNIDSYENGVNLIYSIEDGEYYDIIFLDMYMDKFNGIQVAEKLRNMNYKGKIIFRTTTSKYSVKSYDVEASGYLAVSYTHLDVYKRQGIYLFQIPIYQLIRHSSCNH